MFRLLAKKNHELESRLSEKKTRDENWHAADPYRERHKENKILGGIKVGRKNPSPMAWMGGRRDSETNGNQEGSTLLEIGAIE